MATVQHLDFLADNLVPQIILKNLFLFHEILLQIVQQLGLLPDLFIPLFFGQLFNCYWGNISKDSSFW